MSPATSSALAARATGTASAARTTTGTTRTPGAASRWCSLHSRNARAATDLVHVLLVFRLQHRNVENRDLLTFLQSTEYFGVVEIAHAKAYDSRRVLLVLRDEDKSATSALTASETTLTATCASRTGAPAGSSRCPLASTCSLPSTCTCTRTSGGTSTSTTLTERARSRDARIKPDC
jgi:hypothetical protein